MVRLNPIKTSTHCKTLLQLCLQLQKQERQDRDHKPVHEQERRGDGHRIYRDRTAVRGQRGSTHSPLATFLASRSHSPREAPRPPFGALLHSLEG